jgi:hypothetical protein
MTKIIKRSGLKTLLVMVVNSLLILMNTAQAEQHFGDGADMKQLTAISKILASPNSFIDTPVTVEGTIVKVCKKRGCWVELASDKQFQTLRIKVRDGEMVFPMSTLGKVAYATGQLNALSFNVEQSKKYLAHRAEEQQESFDASTITEAITVYQITPTGVTIKD